MNKPLGGTLVGRIATAKQKSLILKRKLPEVAIPHERVLEAWNIATGAYSPLEGFMTKKDVDNVLSNLRTAHGVFWPIPIVLDIDEKEKRSIGNARKIFLTENGKKVAVLSVDQVYAFPKKRFEKQVFGTNDIAHPGVSRIEGAKQYLVGGSLIWIGGRLQTINPSMTPKETRALFAKKKWNRIVAFHTRNVPHRGHEHVQREGLKKTDGLLIQPLVGSKKKGDFRNEVVAETYRYFTTHVMPKGKAVLNFLPYSAYFGGPREALLTAVIRKNFGCTHFIVGRDHTGVGNFYDAKDYARLINRYEKEIGIEIFHFGPAFYCTLCKKVTFAEECPHDERHRVHPAGNIIRNMLVAGKVPPKEMMRPEIARILVKEKHLFVE